jgi:hypothetical protein
VGAERTEGDNAGKPFWEISYFYFLLVSSGTHVVGVGDSRL